MTTKFEDDNQDSPSIVDADLAKISTNREDNCVKELTVLEKDSKESIYNLIFNK